jgi:hypothetical protein
VKLAEHVNQDVMITGKPDANAEPRDNENRSGKAEPSGKPQIRLRVLTVKTLNPKCPRYRAPGTVVVVREEAR